MLKKCTICGKEFEPTQPEQKCCSPVCRAELTRRYNKLYYLRHPKESTKFYMPKLCENCGKEFEPTTGKQIYCCKKCAAEMQKSLKNKLSA